jgi:hypothetical protein
MEAADAKLREWKWHPFDYFVGRGERIRTCDPLVANRVHNRARQLSNAQAVIAAYGAVHADPKAEWHRRDHVGMEAESSLPEARESVK